MLIVRRVGNALFFGICVLFCSGFISLPPDPDVPNIQFGKKLPVEAALLITEETRNQIFKGKPEAAHTGLDFLISYDFAFGEALEKISLEIFSQIFDRVSLVRTSEEAKKYRLFIEPKVVDCRFRLISEQAFAQPIPYSKVIVHARVGSHDVNIKEVTDEPFEYERGGYRKGLGETTSDALVYSLGRIATQLGEDAAVRKIIENK